MNRFIPSRAVAAFPLNYYSSNTWRRQQNLRIFWEGRASARPKESFFQSALAAEVNFFGGDSAAPCLCVSVADQSRAWMRVARVRKSLTPATS